MFIIKRLIKLSISFLFFILDQAIKIILTAFGRKCRGTCVILYYHVIKEEQLQRFAHQLDVLGRVARPISLEKKLDIEPGIHYAAVTFDDGFRESLQNALPELENRNIPAMIFIPTGCLDLPAPWLKSEQQDDEGGIVISANEIKNLSQRSLILIGSHCHTHRPLATLTDQDAWEEISRSKSDLENILGRKIHTLSFPHGSFKQRDVALARRVGYERVFSIRPALAFTDTNEFVAGRVRVDPTDWPVEFRLKLLGAYRWLSFLRRYKNSEI